MKPFIVGLILWVVYVAISEWWHRYKIKNMREYYRLTGGKRQIDENDPEWRHFLFGGKLGNGTIQADHQDARS